MTCLCCRVETGDKGSKGRSVEDQGNSGDGLRIWRTCKCRRRSKKENVRKTWEEEGGGEDKGEKEEMTAKGLE